MGTIRKRGSSWFAEVRLANHPPRRASFDTKAQAVAWVARTETALRDGHRAESLSAEKTLYDAIERYKSDIMPSHRGSEWEKRRLDKFIREMDFIGDRLRDITKTQLMAWRDARLKVVSPGAVNREINLLSAVFTACVREWNWLSHNPVRDMKRPPNPRPRDRRVTPEETAAMCQALGLTSDDTIPKTQSQRLALAFLLALETGMRSGEIMSLTHDRVHEDYVHLNQTKNGTARDVPLSSKARAILQRVMAVTRGMPTVFEVKNPDALWRKARDQRAVHIVPSVKTLHFHDSRHEAITQLARRIDVLDLARMIGHRDTKSLMIYYNATASEIARRLG